jgi:hypothetical protein
MTHVGTSSLRHFLSSLQAKIFVPNCVMTLLICLIIMPLVLPSVPYLFFISSSNFFSLDLSSRISAGSIPLVGRPVIYVISWTVMGMGLSSHISSPCVTVSSFLTHADAYWPLPKCGIFSNPRIPVLSNPVAHWCG